MEVARHMRRQETRWQSFCHAVNGALYVVRTQPNAWIELALTALALVLGVWLRITRLEWALIAFAVGLVIGMEMLNTAVESAVDLATRDHDPLAARAKDSAAAGVLVASLSALVIGLLIFLPRLWERLIL
ncbi:MAG: diacylglycerol kinase family protein [Anaerolineae bacterium]